MSVPTFSYAITPTSVLVSQTQQLVLTITNASSTAISAGLDLVISVTLPVGTTATDLVDPTGASNVSASPQSAYWGQNVTVDSASVLIEISPIRPTTMDAGGQLVVLISNVAVNGVASTPGATVPVFAENSSGAASPTDLEIAKITAGMSVSAYANPVAVGQGETTTIFWSATGGSHIQLTLNGTVVQDTQFTGAGPIWSGSFNNVTPFPNTPQTTYIVTVLNTGGSQQLSTPVVIGLEPPDILSFTSTKQNGLLVNESVNLAWQTQYGASAYLTPSTGGGSSQVSLQATAYPATPGSWITGTPNASQVKTTLSVTGYQGPVAQDLTFTFAPATIVYFSYATMDPADGIAAAVVSNGSGSAAGGADYTWTLSVTGPGGPLSRGIGFPAPEVRYFGPPNTTIGPTDSLALSWWVNGMVAGDTLTLNGQSVTAGADGKGSTTVTPGATTSYTLLAVLGGQAISNTLTVTVNSSPTTEQA